MLLGKDEVFVTHAFFRTLYETAEIGITWGLITSKQI